MSATQEFQERAARIEGLVQKLEAAADPALRATARELVQCVMELHGTGLERILEIVSTARGAGAGLLETLGHDELVSSLLVLYSLHPEDFETRVRRGIDKARQALRKRGASLDVLTIDETLVRVQIIGAGTEDLQSVVRDALLETTPDASNVVIEGGKQQAHGFVPLASIVASNAAPVLAVDSGRP